MPLGSGTPPEFDLGASAANPTSPFGGALAATPEPPVIPAAQPFTPIGGSPMQPNIPPIAPQNPLGNSAALPTGITQPQLKTQPPAPTSTAWPVPPNSGVDLSMFIPGPQNIPNGSGGHWPVEFQPVNYDPFAGAGGTVPQSSGVQPGGPMNNNLTMR